ncbi:unnamed protein product [Symbiodinium natans]|uniref:Amino acid transporter transmembrane domain-containing protein n=1 Tax=Symbiodinium natans TaxID=878477 RepID=A0A812PFA1_9DINO|nr:unnamed protein product [Symbiodinium natans]
MRGHWALSSPKRSQGYWTFGNEIASDVLKAYPKSYLVAATRLLYSFVAIFSFPLQIHPSRNSAIALMDLVRPSASGSARWAAVTVLELAASLAVAITVLDLGNILGVVGATGSTMVSCASNSPVEPLVNQAFPHFHAKRVLAFGMLLLGRAVMLSLEVAATSILGGCVIMPTCLTLRQVDVGNSLRKRRPLSVLCFRESFHNLPSSLMACCSRPQDGEIETVQAETILETSKIDVQLPEGEAGFPDFKELSKHVYSMEAQMEKQEAEIERQGAEIQKQADEIKDLKERCETAMTLAKEATPLLEWGCLTPQQKLMVQLLVVLFFSVIAVPLPLLIPINDPNEGALKNMTFFYGYNIFVIVYYLPGQYRRLQLLLELPSQKSLGGEMMLKRSATESSALSYLQKATYSDWAVRAVFYLLVIIGWCTGYFLCALPWGTDLVYSYNMLYGAPPTFAMVDWMFLVVAGRRFWNVKTLVLVFVYNFLTLAPVLVLCGVVFASAFFNTPVTEVCAALVSWIVMEAVGFVSDKALKILVPWAGYSLDHYYQVGNALVFSSVLTFSEVILFPSTNSWWALVGVVLVDTLGSMLQLRVLWKCVVTDVQNGVGTSQETKEALWSQCEIDVARFWPVVVALPPLVWLMDDRNPNRQYYYLFECTTSEHMNITVVCILVKLAWTCCLTGLDVFLCTQWGIGPQRAQAMLKMYDKHWVMMTATFALTGAIFTSCWLVKHDGLRLLEVLSEC